jgi:hypothetical protein
VCAEAAASGSCVEQQAIGDAEAVEALQGAGVRESGLGAGLDASTRSINTWSTPRLGEAGGEREPGGTGTDDQDVGLHGQAHPAGSGHDESACVDWAAGIRRR